MMGTPADPGDLIAWELRPGGMLVQKRDSEGDATAANIPMIKLKVSHGLQSHEITVPAQSSFGDLKRLLVHETGLQPEEQRLLFRGKEKDDNEYLHVAGVKDKGKLILVEDPASRERKLEEMRNNEKIDRACKNIAAIATEVDQLTEQVSPLEMAINGGQKVLDKDLDRLTELMMTQLLKLDAIEADGEAKVQRKIQVRRVQNYVDALDGLKNRNAIPHPVADRNNTVVVTTKWETFDNGLGSLTAPAPLQNNSSSITTDWESFD